MFPPKARWVFEYQSIRCLEFMYNFSFGLRKFMKISCCFSSEMQFSIDYRNLNRWNFIVFLLLHLFQHFPFQWLKSIADKIIYNLPNSQRITFQNLLFIASEIEILSYGFWECLFYSISASIIIFSVKKGCFPSEFFRFILKNPRSSTKCEMKCANDCAK